jgi:hypothetical protein
MKGLLTNIDPINQPEDSFTFVLNAVLEQDGNDFNYQNPLGNTKITGIDKIFGSINLQDDDILIFCTINGSDQIGIFNTDSYTPIIAADFNFNNTIKATWRLIRNCDRIIYFADGSNPDRAINIDRLTDYFTNGVFDVSKTELNYSVPKPVISSTEITNTGRLRIGTYWVAVELLDASLNQVAVSNISDPIPIGNGLDKTLFPESEGGIDPISAGIRINLSSVDKSYPYVRLNLITKSNLVYQSPPLPSTLARFNIGNITDYTQGTIETLLLEKANYVTSLSITQVDQRLVRSNLKESDSDWNNFQKAANEIKVGYKFTNKTKTLAHDEIYALGIRYIYKDKISPVFHIPGRAKTNLDRNIVIPDNNTAHLPAKSSYEYWEVYNTGDSERLAYYESPSLYPMTKQCDGSFVYGDLAGTPIRHHKTSLKVGNGNSPVSFTFDFTNINYPDPAIIGHEIVWANYENTVIDEGILMPEHTYGEQSNGANKNFGLIPGQSNLPNNTTFNTNYASFISQDVVFNKNIEGDYVVFSSYYRELPSVALRRTYNYDPNINNVFFHREGLYAIENIQQQNRRIINKTFTEPRTASDIGLTPVFNCSMSNPLQIVQLNASTIPQKWIRAIKKISIDPYQDLESIQYRLFQEPENYIDSFLPLDVDYFRSSRNFFTGEPPTIRVYSVLHFFTGLNTKYIFNKRAVGTGENIAYKFQSGYAQDYIIRRVADLQSNGEYKQREEQTIIEQGLPEYYRYNDDFFYENKNAIHTQLPITFDYCKKCYNEFVNRIAWSQKGFAEDIGDSYRNFLANDYLTLGVTPIIDVAYYKNRLLVKSTNTSFLLSPNPRILNTDAESVFIGTGDFLAVPATEFSQTTYGFAGQQFKHASVTTEHGHAWVDNRDGKVYLFTDTLDELTKGNETLFERVLIDKETRLDWDAENKLLFLFTKDYTFSFDLDKRIVVSEYSFKPDWSFTDIKAFYTVKNFNQTEPNANGIWKHNNPIRTSFYGKKYPFVVEYVQANPPSDLHSINWISKTYDRNRRVEYPTFNKALVYNNNQSTGYFNLLEKQNFWSNLNKEVAYTDGIYRVNQLRDLGQDFEMQYIPDFNTTYRNPVNIDYNRSQWDLMNLRGLYFFIQLVYDEQFKIVFNTKDNETKETNL